MSINNNLDIVRKICDAVGSDNLTFTVNEFGIRVSIYGSDSFTLLQNIVDATGRTFRPPKYGMDEIESISVRSDGEPPITLSIDKRYIYLASKRSVIDDSGPDDAEAIEVHLDEEETV